MDIYIKTPKSYNNYLVCSNNDSSLPSQELNTPKFILQKNIEYFINNLYSNVKIFHKKILTIINSIKNITTGLENQTNHSKSLLKLIVVRNNSYIERYRQLSDRIDMIIESKKILDDNLHFASEIINIFVNDINQIFKKMKNKLQQNNNVIVNKSNEIMKNITNLNRSPSQLSLNKNKLIYRNFENFVQNMKFNEHVHNNNQSKSNNTLIFPNNINQNIFNYTIASREFQKIKKGQDLKFFHINSSNNNDTKEKNEFQNVGNKMVKSSSLPNMNKAFIHNDRYKRNDIDKDKIIELCYKVKNFFDYFNNNINQESDILMNKIKEINILINLILERNSQNKNIISNEKNNNIKDNNKELIKNVEILSKKINDLENKIREKDEYIKYIKKYNNKNDSNKIFGIKQKEGLENDLIKLKELSTENENLKKEIEDKNFKNHELNKLLEANNSLQLEMNEKEQNIAKLNEKIRIFEEESKNKENENNILKENNEEFKNDLKEKNKIIQDINTQMDKYKNEINDLNIKINRANDESQLIMEITSLKKINCSLNKKITDLKKKINPNYNSNINNNDENELDIFPSKEKYFDLIEQNKNIKKEKEDLKIENNKNKEEIRKLKNEIMELNKKINEKELNKNINFSNLSDSYSLSASKNSLELDIVNLNPQNTSKINIDDFKKQNEKLIKLKEMFDKYKNEKQIEISIYKNEFEASKKEVEELKSKLHENKTKIYSSENYNILCDKNYENLHWFLLIPKTKSFSKTYEDLIWVPHKNILNIENFNHFESEYDAQNKILADNLFKLEKKEEEIGKLKYKIKSYEKDINNSNEISNNMDISSIGIDKVNKILAQLNDTEKKLKIIQEENKKLKDELSKQIKSNKISRSNSTDDSNKLAYNKKYKIIVEDDDNNNNNNNNSNNINNENIKEKKNEETEEEEEEGEEDEGEEEEDDEKSESVLSELRNELENTKIELDRITNKYKDLENKFYLLKENVSNLLIKMKVPKKYKADMTEILKLLEFTNNEILFIINKKRLY